MFLNLTFPDTRTANHTHTKKSYFLDVTNRKVHMCHPILVNWAEHFVSKLQMTIEWSKKNRKNKPQIKSTERKLKNWKKPVFLFSLSNLHAKVQNNYDIFFVLARNRKKMTSQYKCFVCHTAKQSSFVLWIAKVRRSMGLWHNSGSDSKYSGINLIRNIT